MVQLLSTLNDKDQVMLLNIFASIKDSWIVVQREVLLKEVNGSIFPKNIQAALQRLCQEYRSGSTFQDQGKVSTSPPRHDHWLPLPLGVLLQD